MHDDDALDEHDQELLDAFEKQFPDNSASREGSGYARPANLRDPLPPGPQAHPHDLRDGWGSRVSDGLDRLAGTDLDRGTRPAESRIDLARNAALDHWLDTGQASGSVAPDRDPTFIERQRAIGGWHPLEDE